MTEKTPYRVWGVVNGEHFKFTVHATDEIEAEEAARLALEADGLPTQVFILGAIPEVNPLIDTNTRTFNEVESRVIKALDDLHEVDNHLSMALYCLKNVSYPVPEHTVQKFNIEQAAQWLRVARKLLEEVRLNGLR